jgi:hypothetical protein
MADVKKVLFGGHASGGAPRVTTKERGQKGEKSKRLQTGLGWNRIRLTLQPLTTISIDTGIGCENRIKGAPPLAILLPDTLQPPFTNPTGAGGTSLLVPVPGTLPSSRLMVIPLPPINNWANINELLPMEINLLVYDPLKHSPGRADTYTSGAA